MMNIPKTDKATVPISSYIGRNTPYVLQMTQSPTPESTINDATDEVFKIITSTWFFASGENNLILCSFIFPKWWNHTILIMYFVCFTISALIVENKLWSLLLQQNLEEYILYALFDYFGTAIYSSCFKTCPSWYFWCLKFSFGHKRECFNLSCMSYNGKVQTNWGRIDVI